MHFAENEISQFTESLWTSLLGLEVRRAPALPGRPESESGSLTACVEITGAWKGAVVVNCSGELASRVASVMFGVAPEALKPEDVRDAVGEISNITGGYVKTMLPGPCHLSLPSVSQNSGLGFSTPTGESVCRVFFECQSHPLQVTLIKI